MGVCGTRLQTVTAVLKLNEKIVYKLIMLVFLLSVNQDEDP